MKRNSGNALKRFLKRKKWITESLLIIFLITGGVAYGVIYSVRRRDIFQRKIKMNII